MGILICFKRKKRIQLIKSGNVLDVLALITAACNSVAENVQKERDMDKETAMNFVIECILQSYSLLK